MKILHSDGRFYMKTEHGEAELLYEIDGNVMSMYHTFVPDAERGNGIAEKLAYAAFEFAKKRNLKVSPDCTYVAHFVEEHEEMRKFVR
ncbi:MAG: N-acetyltransferase [Candidatus Marsarchaeota archaeon]|nr:N-acetyltransferase [Candidatus Marsarchaeota archaeon]